MGYFSYRYRHAKLGIGSPRCINEGILSASAAVNVIFVIVATVVAVVKELEVPHPTRECFLARPRQGLCQAFVDLKCTNPQKIRQREVKLLVQEIQQQQEMKDSSTPKLCQDVYGISIIYQGLLGCVASSFRILLWRWSLGRGLAILIRRWRGCVQMGLRACGGFTGGNSTSTSAASTEFHVTSFTLARGVSLLWRRGSSAPARADQGS